MERDQFDFLNDQVKRLTVALKTYQSRYPPIKDDDKNTGHQHWLNDSKMLSPLLVEYDANIKDLKEECEYYQSQLQKLQRKTEEIVNENNQLHSELRLKATSEDTSQLAADTIRQLENKLQRATDEKNSLKKLYDNTYKEMCEAKEQIKNKNQKGSDLLSENTILKDDLQQARDFATKMKTINNQYKSEQDKILSSVQGCDMQIDELKSENRKLTTEVKTLKNLNTELQTQNSRLKEQIKYFDKDAMRETITEKAADGTIKKLQDEIFELESRVASYLKELNKLQTEKVDLEEQVTSLQKKNASLEDCEYQAILRVRDSVQLVENALLEREQAIVADQQKTQEIARLQDTVNRLMSEGEDQRKKEIHQLKIKTDKDIYQLMEDLHSQETTCAEKQADLERVCREKQTLEKELEKAQKEGPMETLRSDQTMQELRKKLARVELSRDEAVTQYEHLQTTCRRDETRWENDKAILTSQVSASKQSVVTLIQDLQQVSDSRLKLLDEVNRLKKELMAHRDTESAQALSHASKIAILEQTIGIKEKEFDSRQKASEKLHKESIRELREILTVQQKNSAKWRDESRVLCQKFELQVNQLRQEKDDLQKKNKEAIRSHNESLVKADEMEKTCCSQLATIEKIQQLYTDSEERAHKAINQVQVLSNREQQLLNSQKLLQREIDKLKLEKSTPRYGDRHWDSYIAEFSNSRS